jgi:hypothetical protein
MFIKLNIGTLYLQQRCLSQLQIEPLQLGQLSDQGQGAARHLGAAVQVEGPQLVGVLGQRQKPLVRDPDALPDVQDLEVGEGLGEFGQAVVGDGAGGEREGPEASDAGGDVLHGGVGHVGTE